MKINLIGSIFGTSGYDRHTRGLANALHKLGHEVHLDAAMPPGSELMCNDAELEMLKNPRFKEGHNVHISQPPWWPLGMLEPGKSFAGFLVWEGDKVPEAWLDNVQKADMILVPSKHTADALYKTYDRIGGVPGWIKEQGQYHGVHIDKTLDKVKVVPHGIDMELFQGKPSSSKTFTFFANKGWNGTINDRGGLQFLFQAFCEEFKPEEDVELHVKINPAYNPPGWNPVQAFEKLGLRGPVAEKIILNNGILDYEEVIKLYYEADCFVTTSMAEAFNIPVLEAMAAGLPVIVPDQGGHMDFVKKGGSYIVFETEPVENNWDVMYEGVSWARPKISAIKSALRAAYMKWNNPESFSDTNREVAAEYTWENSAKKLLKALE